MPTELMPTALPTNTTPTPSASEKPRRSGDETTVEEIIAAARKASGLPSARGAWMLSLATAVLLWASFTPLDWGFLGWVALVPMILLVRLPQRTTWMYRAVYVGGFLSTFASLQWMRLGDLMMYPAWLALSVYIALYFPLFVAVSRVAVHRFGLPLTLAVPLVWTGTEFLRATVMTGFAWYFLSHTQHTFVELIQISDITGAYGVSFIVALASAAVAGLIPLERLTRLRLLPAGVDAKTWEHPGQRRRQVVAVVVCIAVFGAALTYGFIRRSQAEFVSGPRIALVQGNFPVSVTRDPDETRRIYRQHYWLTGLAVREGRHPDLVVWPEMMYPLPLLEAHEDVSEAQLRQFTPGIPPEAWQARDAHRSLQSLSEQTGAAMIISVHAFSAAAGDFRHYNSAVFVQPERGVTARYDKMHRVPFGEYFPLQDVFPALRRFTPYGAGVDAGLSATVFRVGPYRLSPIICYEDTVPQFVRRTVKDGTATDPDGRPVDVLVNLTNDGWFKGSNELEQHLITAQFRAVECRVPMVRAVNTGISAVIDGDGVVVEPDVFIDGDLQGRTSIRNPETGRLHKSLNAVLVDDVPLDSRRSLYVQYGDWFAGSCAVAVVLLAVGGLRSRRRQSPDDALAQG